MIVFSFKWDNYTWFYSLAILKGYGWCNIRDLPIWGCWYIKFSSHICFKMQFCMKLSLLASLPAKFGGLDGRAIYVDVESKFSSRRYPRHAFLVYLLSGLWFLLYFINLVRHAITQPIKSARLRLIEIGVNSFPELFHMEGMAQEVCSMLIHFFIL